MGSCTHIVDDKEILNQYEYDAWGNVVNQKETIKNRFKFNGQQLDPITQQYYLRARFYNPVVARFTQEDTYRGDGLNLYAYCANNPVYYVDPSGNDCKSIKELIDKIPNKYKQNFQCDKFADYLEKLMKKNGINGERIKVFSNTGYIYSDKLGDIITTNGKHFAIKIDGKIYDNLNLSGIDYEKWKEDLGIGIFPGIEEFIERIID